ncbi:Organic solvent tolerance protein [Bartonella clarridgeiae 73]|uniref:LPS-assembly protein LptD n=1 Tax=Bartonella clarridgeiae (strain CCUG 45776 / CIP 104772 / 73) TaxID=696125 RepID=E6YHA1_BARC7|nr:LPS-assembly protein LptD [Bartonella clarridgeiae]WCR55181.1 MAG: LPS-assembly protein LptD Organic solvent tolerance protein precursor [Bartonella clarridgeiae]CBI76239.1 Organic solvent tolerance protein [Bartonella clarridgeiae 73]
MLASKRRILTKLTTLVLKSLISFSVNIFISHSAIAKNPTPFFKNHLQNTKSPLLLSADKLIYNRDANTISAQGNVQIEYDNNKAVAQRVTYNQKTGRVIAKGNVKIIQKDGNKIYSNYIDMTKDFGEGFVNSLRIKTTNNTYFKAENAKRSKNQITIFNNAIYTACELCHKKLDRAVSWQIKAKKIIWDNVKKTIRFENGHFETFGIPILYFPIVELPDPTVKRASGLLAPHFFYADNLGIGVKNSYFWNLSPYNDFTLSATVYTKQGLLTEGTWHQRLKTGYYNIHFAHIYQINPQNFGNDKIDSQNTNRYMLATKGDFRINSRWVYGWNIFAQSDRDFSRTYKLENYSDPVQISQFYLNGLADQNYFDMRFYRFNIQNSMFKDTLNEHHSQQAWVLPSIDYSFIPNKSVHTGKLTFRSNIQSIYRRHADFSNTNWQGYLLKSPQLFGIAGNSFRLTSELEWKKRFNTKNGLILTPIFALRIDASIINTHNNHIASIENGSLKNFNIASSKIRSMATAGLELRYPFLITAGISTHILEPTAQIFMRNNEQYIGQLPNEDAQSLVFDTTTLFQRDKFSGYDRIEGGTRANIGLRYSGSFNNNWSLYGLVGQSFHLAGKNSFAEKDFININVNAHSGLATARSDYVTMFEANHNRGFSIASRGRFYKKTGKIRRGELEASQKWSNLWASMQYAYISNQPSDEHTQNRQEISFQVGLKFSNYWSINNSASYDLASNTLVKRGINLSYIDECFGISFGYQKVTNPERNIPLKNFNFSFSLRTIADIGKK